MEELIGDMGKRKRKKRKEHKDDDFINVYKKNASFDPIQNIKGKLRGKKLAKQRAKYGYCEDDVWDMRKNIVVL